MLIAVYGHNAIHLFERYASVALVAGFAVVSVATLGVARFGAPFDPTAPFASGGEVGGIIFSAALAFAYAVGWGPAASDYSRYLPRRSDPRAVSGWAFLGGFVPCTLLEVVGAAAVTATRAPGLAGATPADTIVLLAHGNGAVAAIGLATVLLGTVSANSLNLYSGALAALVAWDARRRLSIAFGAAAFLAALTAAVLLLARANDPTARFGVPVIVAAALANAALGFAVVRWTLVRWQSARRRRRARRRARLRRRRPARDRPPLRGLSRTPDDVGRAVGRRAARTPRDDAASHGRAGARRLDRRDRRLGPVLAAELVHGAARRRPPAVGRPQLLRRLRRGVRAGRREGTTQPNVGRHGMTITALRTAAVAAVAFAAGLAVSHLSQPARAAAPPLQPAVYDIGAMTPNDFPAPSPATPNLRGKTFVVADGATVQAQIGTVQKHMHSAANEIQVVISGGGTEWVGDKQAQLHPGVVLVIPAGTAHGGTTDPNLKIVAIKTPPQAPTDFHPVP